MGITKDITLLSLKYQNYLTYLGIIWTVGISLFVAVISYILINLSNLKNPTLIMLGLILIFTEIIFIALHFSLNKRKERVEDEIKNN